MSERQPVAVPLDVSLVAKIGLSVAIVSCLGLMLVLIAVSDEKASNYRQIVGAFDLARDKLGSAMLVLGLVLVGFAGLSAWLFSLYTSFRFAGPLYRISRDLELQIDHGPIAPAPIRAADRLQHEWSVYEASVVALHGQHEELRQVLGEVRHALGTNAETADVTVLLPALARLKRAEQRVRI